MAWEITTGRTGMRRKPLRLYGRGHTMPRRKRIRLTASKPGLGGPRVQSRETSKDQTHAELGVDRRRLTKDTAADHGVIRGRKLTAQVLKAEETR